jgi:hypothetical protein
MAVRTKRFPACVRRYGIAARKDCSTYLPD